MTKYHLKRKTAPKTWPITRKSNTFVIRPRPSGADLSMTLPITIVLRDMLKQVQTAKQAQRVLKDEEVKVNGNRIHHKDDAITFMDVLSIGKDNYRISINKNNVLTVAPVKKGEEITLQKVAGKTSLKGGKTQINFDSGRNAIVSKDTYKVGDSISIDLSGKIQDHYSLAKGSSVFIVGGAHIGVVGVVDSIENGTITITVGKKTLETSANYAFVVGKDKPVITV